MAHIHIECSEVFRKEVKEAVIKNGTSIKNTVIMLLTKWLKEKRTK